MTDKVSLKLPNAPLQEVIFELLWDIGFDQQGNYIDHEFEYALGVFSKHTMMEFPIRKRTIPEGVPVKFYPMTLHQFWKGQNVWPVVQIGPGIMAINDTEKNYTWDFEFYPLISKQVDILEEAYNNNLTYKNASLRYIDAIEISQDDNSNLLNFINLKFKIKLSNQFRLPGNLSNLSLTQTFDFDNDTTVNLILNNGSNKFNKPALIWQTHIVMNGKKGKRGILEWLNKAHIISSSLFKDTLTDEFYASFK